MQFYSLRLKLQQVSFGKKVKIDTRFGSTSICSFMSLCIALIALECLIRKVQEKQQGLKLMAHISFWLTLDMLICWPKILTLCYKEHRSFI